MSEEENSTGELPMRRPDAAVAGRREAIAAFSAFYRDFVARLVAFVEGHGASRADAADIAQETLAKAWREWSSIGYPRTWCYTVAGREYARRMGRLVEVPVAELPERSALLRRLPDSDAVEHLYDLQRIVPTLPPRQRQVMCWTLAGYSPTQIAEILRISPEAARSNLLKARRTLVERLDDSSEE